MMARQDSGFTVLEALVAIALLAAAFIPLLGMQSQFVQRIAAQERLQSRLSAQAALAARLEGINFQQHNAGQLSGEGYVANWQAAPRGPVETSRLSTGEPARFSLQAYTVNITVSYTDGRQDQWQLPGIGWQAKWPVNN